MSYIIVQENPYDMVPIICPTYKNLKNVMSKLVPLSEIKNIKKIPNNPIVIGYHPSNYIPENYCGDCTNEDTRKFYIVFKLDKKVKKANCIGITISSLFDSIQNVEIYDDYIEAITELIEIPVEMAIESYDKRNVILEIENGIIKGKYGDQIYFVIYTVDAVNNECKSNNDDCMEENNSSDTDSKEEDDEENNNSDTDLTEDDDINEKNKEIERANARSRAEEKEKKEYDNNDKKKDTKKAN